MINPLAPVFDWLIKFISIIPQPIRAFISLYWALLVALGVFMAIWKAKH